MADKKSTVPDPLFLGLDISTQQLKAVISDEDGKPTQHAAVQFDRDLPHYGTTNGAIQGPNQGEVTSPVEMWLEAVDLLVERLRDHGVDFGKIRAVSGAAQVCKFCWGPIALTISFLAATWFCLLVNIRRIASFFPGL